MKKVHTLWLEPELYDRIKEAAWKSHMRYNEKVTEIFTEYLDRRLEKEKKGVE